MDKKRIVVALGRNAFGETFPEQQANVKKAAKAIADLVEAKYQIVITHSNGPQVGMIQTAMTEFARLEPEDRTVAPMSVCGAMSEGYIGYDLQNAIREELLNRGIYKTVSTIITQVRVDPFDIAFSEPSKIIGRYMTKEEAEAEEEKGNYVVEEEPGRFRRIIAAPMPIDIYEIDAVKALLSADQIVIAAGGGGIPVLQQGSHLKGASAIIEKDYTAAKLAIYVHTLQKHISLDIISRSITVLLPYPRVHTASTFGQTQLLCTRSACPSKSSILKKRSIAFTGLHCRYFWISAI